MEEEKASPDAIVPAQEGNKLSSLLEEEHYLLQILGYLVEDGLHECRRVCRRWYDACNKLPVRLREIQPDALQRAVEIFPNAEFVCTQTEPNSEGLTVEDIFNTLARFSKLTDLALHSGFDFTKPPAQKTYFHSLTGLTSLILRLPKRDRPPEFYSPLESLTNLICLKLNSFAEAQLNIPSFTGLSKIQTLVIGRMMLFNQSGELMFPSLNSLTHLECWHDVYQTTTGTMQTLEAIGTYADSLRSLMFLMDQPEGDIDWSLLKSFVGVRSFLFPSVGEDHLPLFSVLAEMDNIMELEMNCPGLHPTNEDLPAAINAICTLRMLKSLTVSCPLPNGAQAEGNGGLSTLTQLTMLDVVGGLTKPSLQNLAGLVHLVITNHQESNADLFDALKYTKELRVLHITYTRELVFPMEVFSQLSKLESLKLDIPRLDQDFFSSFASISGLRELNFRTRRNEAGSETFASQITLLSNLQELTVGREIASNPVQYLRQGSFPRLRLLILRTKRRLPDEDIQTVNDRFPQLRTFKVVFSGRAFTIR